MNTAAVHAEISVGSVIEQTEEPVSEQEDEIEESSLLDGSGEYKYVKVRKDKSQDPSKSPPPKIKPVEPPVLTVVPNPLELAMFKLDNFMKLQTETANKQSADIATQQAQINGISANLVSVCDFLKSAPWLESTRPFTSSEIDADVNSVSSEAPVLSSTRTAAYLATLPSNQASSGSAGTAKQVQKDVAVPSALVQKQKITAPADPPAGETPMQVDGSGTTESTPIKEFWAKSEEVYIPAPIYGEGLVDSVASSAKTYFEAEMRKEEIDGRMEKYMIPSNCTFLKPRRCNTAVFNMVPQQIKTNEQGIQRALDIQACSSSATFKAASELSFSMFALERVKANGTDQEKLDFLNNFSLQGPVRVLQDALQLAGAANQQLEITRRKVIKPNFPDHMVKAVETSVPEDPHLLYSKEIEKEVEELLAKKKAKQPSSTAKNKAAKGQNSKKTPYTKNGGFRAGRSNAGGRQQMPQPMPWMSFDPSSLYVQQGAQNHPQPMLQMMPMPNLSLQSSQTNQKRGGYKGGRGGKK